MAQAHGSIFTVKQESQWHTNDIGTAADSHSFTFQVVTNGLNQAEDSEGSAAVEDWFVLLQS